jgi:hypothetical protein
LSAGRYREFRRLPGTALTPPTSSTLHATPSLDRRLRSLVDVWERLWLWRAANEPPAVRKTIYTINAIESLNYQLRKIIKDRGDFPND